MKQGEIFSRKNKAVAVIGGRNVRGEPGDLWQPPSYR